MFNYDNIGEKIKSWAKWIAIVESVLSVIGGILVMVNEIGGGDSWLLMGPLLMILGPMIAWVSSWLLYGFGEIVSASIIYQYESYDKGNSYMNSSDSEDMKELAERAQKESTEREIASKNAPIIEINRWGDGICPECHKPINLDPNILHAICPKCKSPLKTKKRTSI